MGRQLLAATLAVALLAAVSQAALVELWSAISVDQKFFWLAYDDASTNPASGSGISNGHNWYGVRLYCSDPSVAYTGLEVKVASNSRFSQITPIVEDETGAMVSTPTVWTDSNGYIQLTGADVRDDTQLTWSSTAGHISAAQESASLLHGSIGFYTSQIPGSNGLNVARFSMVPGVNFPDVFLRAGSLDGIRFGFLSSSGSPMEAGWYAPEPATLSLLGLGAMALLRRRK